MYFRIARKLLFLCHEGFPIVRLTMACYYLKYYQVELLAGILQRTFHVQKDVVVGISSPLEWALTIAIIVRS